MYIQYRWTCLYLLIKFINVKCTVVVCVRVYECVCVLYAYMRSCLQCVYARVCVVILSTTINIVEL